MGNAGESMSGIQGMVNVPSFQVTDIKVSTANSEGRRGISWGTNLWGTSKAFQVFHHLLRRGAKHQKRCMRRILSKNEKFMISFNSNESFERGCSKCMKKPSATEVLVVE